MQWLRTVLGSAESYIITPFSRIAIHTWSYLMTLSISSLPQEFSKSNWIHFPWTFRWSQQESGANQRRHVSASIVKSTEDDRLVLYILATGCLVVAKFEISCSSVLQAKRAWDIGNLSNADKTWNGIFPTYSNGETLKETFRIASWSVLSPTWSNNQIICG